MVKKFRNQFESDLPGRYEDGEENPLACHGGVVIIMSVTCQYQSECQCPRYKTEQ